MASTNAARDAAIGVSRVGGRQIGAERRKQRWPYAARVAGTSAPDGAGRIVWHMAGDGHVRPNPLRLMVLIRGDRGRNLSRPENGNARREHESHKAGLSGPDSIAQPKLPGNGSGPECQNPQRQSHKRDQGNPQRLILQCLEGINSALDLTGPSAHIPQAVKLGVGPAHFVVCVGEPANNSKREQLWAVSESSSAVLFHLTLSHQIHAARRR